MNNLFRKGREENWKRFFSNDRVMLTQALAICQTGIIKIDHNDVQRDYTKEELWQRITYGSKTN